MYGFNRLKSAKRLRPLFTAGPSPTRLLRSFPFSHTSGIDDLVYVGEGAKILGKDEKISQSRNAKGTYERKVLPPELLARNVVKLTCESAADGSTCDVYLVGTCHISPVVFLELCSQRSDYLNAPKVPTLEEMRDMWKKNENPLTILSKWFDAKLERSYGGEFIVEYEEAMRYGGKVILGDRPDKITDERLWVNIKLLSLWELTKLATSIFTCYPILLSSAKALVKKVGFLECLTLELQSLHPTLMGPLVHERDQLISIYV